MVRRLVIATVTVVAGALAAAGLGTLALVQLSARREARAELARQASAVAEGVRGIGLVELQVSQRTGSPARPVLQVFRRALRLQGAELMRFGPAGRTVDPAPEGLDPAHLDLGALRSGRTVSGTSGDTVWAAAPVFQRGGVLTVVVLTRTVGSGLRSGARWFAVAATGALVAAVGVSWSLGQRITRPVRAVEDAARRIAAGDLDVRVASPGAGDELDALAAAVNTMAAELARARSLERQFLMSVSHDLRTPLTSIRGYAEAIADGTAPDPVRAGGVIAAEARRLERLVRDLIDLARLDARRFSLDVRTIDVRPVVAATVEAFRPAAADTGVILTFSPAEDLPAVDADPERLGQVVANLLDNALKYARSSVTVSATPDGGDVLITVDDDGPGIAPEEIPRVFERLYTAGRAPLRAAAGSGLGLAIVRELVEAMGGSVAACSPPPGATAGARVAVRLTRWSEERVAPGPAAS
jgi:signal transduction histidine kinase